VPLDVRVRHNTCIHKLTYTHTNKTQVLLLNKADLVPLDVRVRWAEYLRKNAPHLRFYFFSTLEEQEQDSAHHNDNDNDAQNEDVHAGDHDHARAQDSAHHDERDAHNVDNVCDDDDDGHVHTEDCAHGGDRNEDVIEDAVYVDADRSSARNKNSFSGLQTEGMSGQYIHTYRMYFGFSNTYILVWSKRKFIHTCILPWCSMHKD
jgi:hypothetical protein